MLTSDSSLTKLWMLTSNLAMSVSWFWVFVDLMTLALTDDAEKSADRLVDEAQCLEQLKPTVKQALLVSFLELFNAIFGFTRSKPPQVLLFSTVRACSELLAAPLLSCASWQHLLTVACWSLGDTVRFGCFTVATLWPNAQWVKAVRYTVGPILFPVGAFGEMIMVATLAYEGRPVLYLAASLWPVGFYPLIRQLLRQRSKFFAKLKSSKTD